MEECEQRLCLLLRMLLESGVREPGTGSKVERVSWTRTQALKLRHDTQQLVTIILSEQSRTIIPEPQGYKMEPNNVRDFHNANGIGYAEAKPLGQWIVHQRGGEYSNPQQWLRSLLEHRPAGDTG